MGNEVMQGGQDDDLGALFDALSGVGGGGEETSTEGNPAILDSLDEEKGEKVNTPSEEKQEIPQGTTPPVQPTEEVKEGEVGTGEAEVDPDVAQLIGELLGSPEDAPKRLQAFLKKHKEISQQEVVDAIPKMLENVDNLKKRVDKFYQDHPELGDHKDYVGFLGVELENKNPDWDTEKLYDETAKEAYRRLKLQKGKPSLPDTGADGGTVGKKQSLSAQDLQDKDLVDMVNYHRQT